jgi:hypothetical protein
LDALPSASQALLNPQVLYTVIYLRACLVRMRVKPFCGFWRTWKTYLIALFGRNASKTEEAAL